MVDPVRRTERVTHVLVGVQCVACRGTGLVYDSEGVGLVGCGVCDRRRFVQRSLPLAEFVELLRREGGG